jgi:hypothetical protein
MSDMAKKARGYETAGDMVRSLLVLLGLVAAVVVAFTVMKPDARLPDPVDYANVLDLVRDDYPYPVLAPTPVPDGWRATSVDHDQDPAGHRWRLGFLTADEDFIGLEQSDGEIDTFVRDRVGPATFEPDGTSVVDGVRWERRVENGADPDRALVLVTGDVATIVRGTAPYDDLEEFAASLR